MDGRRHQTSPFLPAFDMTGRPQPRDSTLGWRSRSVHFVVSFDLDTPNTSVRSSRLARALYGTACGLAAFLCLESAANAQPPKLRRLQQQQQKQEPSSPDAAPPPAPIAGEPAPMLLSAPPDSAVDRADAESDSSKSDKPRQFGAMFDLGVPDGTMLSFVYRPVEMARFHAGAGYNGISPGLRIGGVFLPLGWGPALEIDYGHYFEGDANGLAGLFGDTGDGSVVLDSIGYDYVNFRGGMDFGGERFTFFAHGGISWLRTTIHEFDTLLGPSGDPQSNTSIAIRRDPVLNAWVPNLQLGFIVHL